MNELIKITENNGRKAVSARELYEFLGLSERFSKWFERFSEYGFEDGVDYTPYQTVHPLNGQEIIDYAMTIDMAKELSMLQRNEKGKQARRYFIACEKVVKSNIHEVPKLQDLTAAKIMAVDYTVKLLNLNDASKLPLIQAINEPLGLPTPDYVESKGVLVTISDIAKEIGLTAAKANQILASLGVLEKKTRKSTKDKGKEKCFWAIAAEYSYLGENLVNPSNQSETQPKWYVEKKNEVLELLQKKEVA